MPVKTSRNCNALIDISEAVLQLMYSREIYDPTIKDKVKNPRLAWEESMR